MFTNQDVARYYDLSEVHYRLFWRLEKSHSLHYGYWDHNTRNFHEALLNLNRVMAEKARISERDTVLDAGCGVGGSSIWMARQIGCTVTGISLNAKQVEKAVGFAREAGLAGKISFAQKDYLHTGYADASFDVVWAVESVCYAADKALFLQEAFRLLRKGGRLVIADFFTPATLAGKPAEMVKRFSHSWAINAFAVWEKFVQQLEAAGFTNLAAEDASRAIMPSAKRLFRAYWIGKPAALLYRAFYGKPTSLAVNNVESARLQYITLKKGWWQYRILVAEKR